MRAALPSLQSRTHGRGVLLTALAALLPLFAFASIAVFMTLGAYRAADEARLRDTARALAAAVDAQLGTYVAALKTLASSRLLDGPLDTEAFEARARRVGEDFGGWMVLLGPPPDHAVLAMSIRPDGAGLPAQLPAPNQLAIAGLLNSVFADGKVGVSDLFTGSVVQRPILTAMVPVFSNGQPPRALSLSFEPSALRALLARQDLPAGTFAAVADGQFRILAHSFDPEGRQVGMPAPAWAATAIGDKQRTLVVGPGWSGQDNVYAVERLAMAPGWTVTVAQPLANQQTAAWRALRWLLVGGVALGVGLVVAVWASRDEALRDARREAEALRAGRAEVERLHTGLPAVIFLREADPDGSTRLVYRGGDIESVTGWPADTFKDVDSLRPWVDLEPTEFRAFISKVLRDGAAVIEYRMRQPDGAWRWTRSRCRRLSRRPDGGGEVVGYMLDISTERAAEGRAMAAGRLASLGEMAAGLAHELKQPLAIISLAVENASRALETGNAAGVASRLVRIGAQARRAASVIENLRRFARGPEAGSPAREVCLGEAVAGALSLVGGLLHDAGVEVVLELADPPPAVLGDLVAIEQVLLNLLTNARDALADRAEGGPRQVRVAAEADTATGVVRLIVSDNGGGIPDAVLARLFEPFMTTKSPEKGTGLGLSICHGLMRAMGGSISAINGAEGAVFTVTLLAAPAAGASEAALVHGGR